MSGDLKLPDGRCAICGKRGLHVCIDGPRKSDYEWSPGREVDVRIGAVSFGANTADGGRVGVSIAVGRWGFVWSAGTVE